MTEDDLAHVENRLGVQLPDDYRRFVLNHPGGELSQREVVDRAEYVIDETTRMRLTVFGWPDECVVIGDSGCGDYCCLDLREHPANVVCWNHETRELDYESYAFLEWVRYLTEKPSVPCPCCGYCTLWERTDYDICEVCRWEDDGQDNYNASSEIGGPNGRLSLAQARFNFLMTGICKPHRADLRRTQVPCEQFAQGRVFTLTADGKGVQEPAAGWIASIDQQQI